MGIGSAPEFEMACLILITNLKTVDCTNDLAYPSGSDPNPNTCTVVTNAVAITHCYRCRYHPSRLPVAAHVAVVITIAKPTSLSISYLPYLRTYVLTHRDNSLSHASYPHPHSRPAPLSTTAAFPSDFPFFPRPALHPSSLHLSMPVPMPTSVLSLGCR